SVTWSKERAVGLTAGCEHPSVNASHFRWRDVASLAQEHTGYGAAISHHGGNELRPFDRGARCEMSTHGAANRDSCHSSSMSFFGKPLRTLRQRGPPGPDPRQPCFLIAPG